MLEFAILIPFLLLLLLIWFATRPKNRAKFQLNKKFIYTLVAAYVLILLIATVTIETFEKKFAAEMPDRVDDSYSIDESYIDRDIGPIDPSFIIEQRVHNVGDRLYFQTNKYNYENPVSIFIERKRDNDGVVKETIYKPTLFDDGFDFSDRYQYALPKWSGDTLSFPAPPETIINYSSYRDATLLGQFTKEPVSNSYSHRGMYRGITVHLLVPKDLIIDADEDFYLEFINE